MSAIKSTKTIDGYSVAVDRVHTYTIVKSSRGTWFAFRASTGSVAATAKTYGELIELLEKRHAT